MSRCACRGLFLLAALAAPLAACDRPPDPATRAREVAGRVFRGTLIYPNSGLVSVAAGEEAAELVLTTPAAPAQVAQYYREILRLNRWEVKHDATQRDGAIAMYAERDGRPLWLTLRANSGGPGTTYTLVGVDIRGDTLR